MRHQVRKVRLSRNTSHRLAMMRNLATSLVLHERIQTTITKAKELRRVADQMITLGKKGTLHARRSAASFLKRKEAVAKVFGDLSERFKERNGGYTRIYKLGFRSGDGAPMVLIEYLGYKLRAPAATKTPQDS